MNLAPENLVYTQEHEWALIEGEHATIGITDFAQSSLGDIVFVELPEVGTQLIKDQTFGVVESIKSVSDLYVPLSGEVLAINQALLDAPESINSSPYQSWLIKLKMTNDSEKNQLMTAETYQKHCQSADH